MRSTSHYAQAAAGILLGASLFTTPVRAATLDLSPSSEWKLREYDDKCRISRTFGEGEDRVTLWLDQGGPGQVYNLTLIGQPLDKPYGPAVRIQLGEEEEIIRSYISARSSKDRPVLRMYGLTLVQPEMDREDDAEAPDIAISEARAAAITTMQLRGADLGKITFDLGEMGAQFRSLQSCGKRVGALLTEAGRPLTGEATPPQPIDEDSWLQISDWPRYLQSSEMEGKIDVRLTVAKNGKANACAVVKSNKPQLFDDAVCLGLMKRAKFDPARNGSGDPVPSYFFQRVTFKFR